MDFKLFTNDRMSRPLRGKWGQVDRALNDIGFGAAAVIAICTAAKYTIRLFVRNNDNYRS
jgi:hypothetical protein